MAILSNIYSALFFNMKLNSFPNFFQVGLKAFAFIPFVVITLLGATITYKYVKETKNKSYDEIAQMYYGNGVHNLVGLDCSFVAKYLSKTQIKNMRFLG